MNIFKTAAIAVEWVASICIRGNETGSDTFFGQYSSLTSEDEFPAAMALLDTVQTNPKHQQAGSLHWMISDCYEKLKESGEITPKEADPIIEWGYQTLFEKYADSPDVRYGAVRLAEINMARGRPATALVYVNWLMDVSFDDPVSQRKALISRLNSVLEENVR